MEEEKGSRQFWVYCFRDEINNSDLTDFSAGGSLSKGTFYREEEKEIYDLSNPLNRLWHMNNNRISLTTIEAQNNRIGCASICDNGHSFAVTVLRAKTNKFALEYFQFLDHLL